MKRELREATDQVGHGPDDLVRLLGIPRRTVENWLSPGHPAHIRPSMLRLYRHLAGIERIPFRKSSR